MFSSRRVDAMGMRNKLGGNNGDSVIVVWIVRQTEGARIVPI